MNQWNYMPPMYQRQEVIRVNGENGARALNLPPNSSALVLDENDPLVWLCQTDGAGYKTVTAYKISVVEKAHETSYKELVDKIERLEAMIYEQSNSGRNASEKQSGIGFKSCAEQVSTAGD